MKILVTGGCGFIGSHIADRIIAMGHDVSVIDNLSTGRRENLNPKARLYECDIREKEAGRIISEEKPRVIFHLAAQINVRKSEEDPFADTDININGSVNIIRNFVALKGEKKLVFSSTGGAIYGETPMLPTPETAEPQPLSPYGISKLAVEKYLSYYAFFYELSFAALRYGNVYGPRQNALSEAGVISIFTLKMLENETPVIFGDGTQTRDFIHVDDVVESNIISMEKNLEGVFNVGTGIETDINTIFSLIKKATGSDAEKTHAGEQRGEVKRSCLSYEKIEEAAGWHPSSTVEEGIKKTVSWFKSVRG